MASPAPQGDQGDLPPPWIRQFHPSYQTYFYVNPTTNPPTTSWTHPSLPEGQVHPEQAQAIDEAQQTGGNNQGEAAKFLNSGSVADPATGSYSQQAQIQGAGRQNPETGERGLGSMVSGLMGKTSNNNQYGYQQQYSQYPQQQQSGGSKLGFGTGMAAGGAALLAGKLLSNVIGHHHHSSGGMFGGAGGYHHNMGPPPFMGGGGPPHGGHHGGHHGGGMFGGGPGGFGGGPPGRCPSISPRAQPTAQPHITLKLKHSMADRANYSSSEEEEEGEEEQIAEDRLSPSPPPSKKKRLSSTPTKSSIASKGKQSIKLTLGPQHPHLRQPSSSSSTSAGSAANQGKKSYDWLQPSAAGASHSGPLERERERERSAHSPGDLPVPSASVASAASNSSTKSQGMSPAEEAIGGLLDESVDDNVVINGNNNNGDPPSLKKGKETVPKAKRSHHKKASDAPPGPGKNWKKGMKKAASGASGVKLEKEGTPASTPAFSAISRETSLDPLGLPSPRLAPETQSTTTTPAPAPPPSASRAPSPPFIPADPTTLGFPVFSHPIVPPKIHLGTFPKVTSFFAPINGGDSGPFPRKEKVRNWTFQEKGIVGVGGGVMKFKSWVRGPTSELERALQEEKEAQTPQRQQPKAAKGTNATSTPAPQIGVDPTASASTSSTPAPPNATITADSMTAVNNEHPSVSRANSFDKSVNASPGPPPGDDESENGSEDAGPISTPPAAGGKKKMGSAPGKKKGKTPKSKLAQEIVIRDDNDEGTQVEMTAE
nr:hypothetical protein I308_05723 [Cryptococcus tetragattii IND107]